MKLPKFRPCTKCNNGYIYKKNAFDEDVVSICNCLEKYQYQIHILQKLEKAGIIASPLLLNYSIDRDYIGPDKQNNIPKFKKYIEDFEKTFYDKTLYFYGVPGTQKTTIATWIAMELIKKDISVYYTIMNDLIKDLQENTFSEEDLESRYYDCDCLIIDRAFGKDQVTIYKSGYQIPFLDNFLRKRIDQLQKGTIIISNNEVHEISNAGFNSDIESLIDRKTRPFDSIFYFGDHYSIKDDFDNIDLWS
jgi:DNA replication protein DnaC